MDGKRLPQKDIDVLRGLAERAMEIAHSDINLERKDLWYRLDKDTSGRPMVLAEDFGIQDANAPLLSLVRQCTDHRAMRIEAALRYQIYLFDELRDDHVAEPCFNVAWTIQFGDFGVRPVEHTTENQGRMTSKKWDPPIKDLDRDFEKLKPRTFKVDRESTSGRLEFAENIFGDILPVRIRGMFGSLLWSMGMTEPLMKLHGLDGLMYSTIDNPDGLHRLMAFLHDDHLGFARWAESEGLLTLNNENDYIGSGSIGYSHDLPQEDKKDGDPILLKDLWVLLESQETVGVGPTHFEEIFLPYQVSLAENFGKCYYGCCEPVNNRLHAIKKIPNLSRISVSPWADETVMAEELGTDYVYSRKPSPAQISSERFDEDEIRSDIANTLDVARGCRIEIVMKDVHTLSNQRERLPRWVEIAREEIDKVT